MKLSACLHAHPSQNAGEHLLSLSVVHGQIETKRKEEREALKLEFPERKRVTPK